MAETIRRQVIDAICKIVAFILAIVLVVLMSVYRVHSHTNTTQHQYVSAFTCEPHTDPVLIAIEAPRKCELIFYRVGSSSDPAMGAK